ncbi:hypothetical protein T12_13759 [Trichinella patagoniensis]|uniref:Uncharacterized protein n=1 Tax=Trichinella patagoniensis TaxID=990121 RepID=A0A0V0ZH60_9BILA|nr:hypothetical protein T12_13759 [Trichinella patagoniensis]
MKHCTGMVEYFPNDLLPNSTSSMILISIAFICYFRSSFTNPPIAQLEERWTVAESTEIHRSLVQIRLGGSKEYTNERYNTTHTLTLRWHRCERIQCEISNAKSVKMPSDKSYNCAISTASRCHEFSVRDCRVQHAMQTLFHRSDTEKTTCFSIRYRFTIVSILNVTHFVQT